MSNSAGNPQQPEDSAERRDETADLSSAPVPHVPQSVPDRIDRYRVEKILGSGGFGCVYLAKDERLDRWVAIKVPREANQATGEAVARYAHEARTVASLDHPNIVPLYDVGKSERYPSFLVSKFVEGVNLAGWQGSYRPTWMETTHLIATVAEALHHAHQRGLFHRDIKPANILVDSSQRPYLTDFGLALKEDELGTGPRFIGSPFYMSPEQARGEGHLVDGRTDIFSLGVVMYEMLTGHRPFKGDTPQVVLQQVQSLDARPPRQLNDAVPRELERICLKAIAKRASDRYTTARDLAEDLRWLLDRTAGQSGSQSGEASSIRGPLNKVVPKGLRSFDANDSDFFLDLLPGPHDRDGLPESIRFWKNRIEERDAEETFRIALIYGPSGCGKSSMVKAGLLPRLETNVVPVYVEAATEGTIERLVRGLRKGRPELAEGLPLKEYLAAFRRGAYLHPSQKLLLVIDQFEQYLHARQDGPDDDFVEALRQCDGERVQCILLLRDDFWMAVTEFMRELEVRIVEGRNSAPLSLFDPLHARKVLAEFGRAYDRLPDDLRELSPEQEAFLDNAVQGLTEGGRVVPVRLSLFAEMIKGRPWTAETLNRLGGMEGVGASFLEESFSSTTAPPQHRRHQRAARSVLGALLPDRGMQITGHMRSYGELVDASGYSSRPEEFEDLLRILDDEVRLITPVDREGSNSAEDSVERDGGENTRRRIVHLKETKRSLRLKSPARYYKLTHDYLVPSLRQWLAHKQRETRRGRAQLRLVELAAAWPDPPDNRFLPGVWDALGIWFLTDRREWGGSQQQMMRHAARYYSLRGLVLVAILVLLTVAGLRVRREMLDLRRLTEMQQVESVVQDLLRDSNDRVSSHLLELNAKAEMAAPMLREVFDDLERDVTARTRAALGLAACGIVEVEFLANQMGRVPDEEVRLLAVALSRDPNSANQLVDIGGQMTDSLGRARLAAITLEMGDDRLAREVFAYRSDPQERTVLVHGLALWCNELDGCARMLESNTDPALRSGICEAVGLAESGRFYSAADRRLLRVVADLFETDPHPGVHSAAGRALRAHQNSRAAVELKSTYDFPVPPELPVPESPVSLKKWLESAFPGVSPEKATTQQIAAYATYHEGFYQRAQATEPSNGRNWYMERFQLAMLRVAAGPTAKDESPIQRDFFVSAREITSKQYETFLNDVHYPEQDRATGHAPRAVGVAVPMTGVSWRDALLFCNWLSRRTGRSPCYYRSDDQPVESTTLEPLDEEWSFDPAADGYRLPTEVEWRHACRGGTTTRYAFGDDPKWLPTYAVYVENSRQPTPGGDLLGNAFGCFDMHGNVWEWCQSGRRLLGGAFDQPADSVTSATTRDVDADLRDPSAGFRVVRSIFK